MIVLRPAGHIRRGNWIVPEQYDEHLRPEDYDEAQTVEVMDVLPVVGSDQVQIVTAGDAARVDPDAPILVATQSRDHAVLCRKCSSTTWNPDAICNRCK